MYRLKKSSKIAHQRKPGRAGALFGYILFLFILFIVQRFVHSRKTKSFQHSVKMNPRKSFCFPLLVPARFLLPFPLFSSSPPHKIHFFVGAPSIHHRSVDKGKQWQRDGNETNQGKRRRRLLHVGRRNGKN